MVSIYIGWVTIWQTGYVADCSVTAGFVSADEVSKEMLRCGKIA